MSDRFTIRFWGVRGSIPCPGPATARFGGNTSCVEVRCGNRLIIFDGGTGLRELGVALMASGKAINADILLSHCHIDHVSGIPFFAPFFSAANTFRLWAGHLLPDFNLEDALRSLMSHPLFPIEVEVFQADIRNRDFRAGETGDRRRGGGQSEGAFKNEEFADESVQPRQAERGKHRDTHPAAKKRGPLH